MKNVLRLFSVSLLLFIAACTPKKDIVMPSFDAVNIIDYLAEKRNITEIETTFSIVFQKKDAEISGEGALNISQGGDMSLRVYSLGFLAVELTSENGISRSSPYLDRNKKLILTQGLRDCLFWWDAKDFIILDEGGQYHLEMPGRTLWLDKKTFLPLAQRISFADGRELRVSYDTPKRENDFWYQSRIRIEYLHYSVILTVRNIAYRTGAASLSLPAPDQLRPF